LVLRAGSKYSSFVDIGCSRLADKGRVTDGENVAIGIEKADDIELWTSQQIEYLRRRRAAFKGVITKEHQESQGYRCQEW